MINCNNIPLKDKGCHFIAGFVIALIVALVFTPMVGFIAGFTAGVLKEAYDEYSYGGGDFFDFFMTLAGTALGVMFYGLIDILILG